ncbi:MAG: hypothetical protein DWH80_00040 [Planctomycetota bacterium]|nr:MAG: hypothetical protein DWH80_00040 [Planctomycetota bacterium]
MWFSGFRGRSFIQFIATLCQQWGRSGRESRRVRPSKIRPVESRVAPTHAIERLEDRVLLSAFTASGSTLNVDLNTANANVAIVSSGTSYTLTLTGDTWNGTDSANVTGNGTSTLTVTAAGLAAFDTISITDSAAGESVTFDDSGANTYQDDFSVVLDNTGAGVITFNGATHFAGASGLSGLTTRNIQLNSGSSVTTINGNLTLSANAAGTTTGDFSGLRAENATIQTTGSGNIVVTGRGGNDAATGSHIGIALVNGSFINASGTGAVTLMGTGGVGNGLDAGVHVEASQVTAVSGGITVTGNANTTATGDYNIGIRVLFGGQIKATGSGGVTINGTGAGGANNNWGVSVEAANSMISVVDGTLSITGTGSANSSGGFNVGVLVDNGAELKSTGSGNLNIAGTGGTGGNPYAIMLGSTGMGTITTSAGTGSLTLVGDGISIDVVNGSNINAGTNLVTLKQKTNGTLINLGGADVLSGSPLTLGLTDTELDRITAGTVQIGDASSGAITVSAVISRAASTNLVLTTGGSITVNEGLATHGGSLTLSATNGITLSNSLTTSGGNVTLSADSDANGSGTLTISAVSWSQPTQLNEASGAARDNFGSSVALSSDGNTAIVGAYGDDVDGKPNQGTATIFVRSGGVWTQQTLLTATGGATGDNFGVSVALSGDGNTAIVGAYGDTISGNGSQGSATIFIRSGGVWTQQQQVTATGGAAVDFFGNSVALSSDGNTAIVGAYVDDVGGNANQGSATIFTRSGGVWTQQQQLTATGGAANDNFGSSVALSSDGNTAIVGAYVDDVGGNVNQGSATIFTRSGGVWTQQQQVTDAGGAANDKFGSSVALSSDGNTAIVGAFLDDVGGNVDQGSATIFTRSGGVWTQQAQVTATSGAARDNFGSSVALSSDGNTAIVGADMDDVGGNGDQGTATIYTRSGGVWTQQQQVTATGGTGFDHFGASVALSSDGNTAIVGASWDDVGGNMEQGSATIFTRSSGVWTQQQQVTATGGAANDFFGFSVALNSAGNTAIVGADWDDVGVNADQGSAFTFVQSNPGSISAGGGTITIQAADIDLQGTLSSTATVSLSSEQAGRAIDLGTNTVNTLGLTDAELGQITAGQLNIGGVNSGAITVSAAISRLASTTLQLKSGGAINFTTGSLASAGGNVTLDPGTSVSPTTTGLDVNAGTGTLAFGSNDDLAIDITGTTVDTQYRQLNVIGVVSLTGVDLVLSGSPSLAGGESFTIVNNDGTDAVVGTFNGLAEGATISNFLGSGKNARISYVGGTGNDVVVTVNSAPVIGSFNSTVAYTASGPATVLGANASVTDVDTTRFNGATLTISQSGFTEASDRLEIRSVTRLVAVSGSNVTYRGTIVGTVSGGTGSSALVIVFNGNATQSAVQTVLRNVTFRSVSPTPATTTRTVQITLTDGEGGTSNVPTRSITVVASPGAFAPGGVAPATPAPPAVSAPVAGALEAAFAAQTMAMSSATSNAIKPVADTGDLPAPAFIKALTEWRLAVASASTTSDGDSQTPRRLVRHAMITESVSSFDHATTEQTLVENAVDDVFARIESWY